MFNGSWKHQNNSYICNLISKIMIYNFIKIIKYNILYVYKYMHTYTRNCDDLL